MIAGCRRQTINTFLILSKNVRHNFLLENCRIIIVIYLTSSCVILAFFGMSGPV
jgi:hypothetical protein